MSATTENLEKCPLCERSVPPEHVEKHHLFPKSKRRHARKQVSSEQASKTVKLCCDCHGQIHQLFSTKELVGWYNTIGHLKEDVDMIQFIEWVRDKKRFGMTMARKKKR